MNSVLTAITHKNLKNDWKYKNTHHRKKSVELQRKKSKRCQNEPWILSIVETKCGKLDKELLNDNQKYRQTWSPNIFYGIHLSTS